MAFQTSKGEQTTMNEINIVPLVDVMLVLLIIFMVTAPLLSESIDVDLPQVTAASSQTDKNDKVLTINQEGEVFVQGDEKQIYDVNTLGPRLTKLFENSPSADKVIFLRADKNVSYGTVVQIMALCKEVGISRIGMITEPEEETEHGS
jgi:biopolymer transport protein TolR